MLKSWIFCSFRCIYHLKGSFVPCNVDVDGGGKQAILFCWGKTTLRVCLLQKLMPLLVRLLTMVRCLGFTWGTQYWNQQYFQKYLILSRDAPQNSSSRTTGLQNLNIHYVLAFKGSKHKPPKKIQCHTCSQILLPKAFFKK